MIIDYSCNTYHGVCMDAIGIKTYREFGPGSVPAGVAPPPDDWKGLPGIIIERSHGPKIELVFDEDNERDTLYTNLLHQVQQQIGR